MKWMTWENVGVDRMACGWLIRRFIDPDAEFSFIPMSQKSFPEGVEPFDIPGARLSHHQGHCTFHTMLGVYRLDDAILRRIARIVDEADVVQEAMVEPSAPGLDLICRGIRLISENDTMALERGAMIYNGLYAQLSKAEE